MAKKKTDAPDDAKAAKSKKIKIIGALVVAAVGYKFFLAPKPAPAEAADPTKIEEGAVVSLPDLTLNLADTNATRYLRVGIALILEKGTTAEAVKEELPIASDTAVDVLSALTYAELQKPDAKTHVKEELSEKVREAFHDEKVARVIFTSFVMQ